MRARPSVAGRYDDDSFFAGSFRDPDDEIKPPSSEAAAAVGMKEQGGAARQEVFPPDSFPEGPEHPMPSIQAATPTPTRHDHSGKPRFK